MGSLTLYSVWLGVVRFLVNDPLVGFEEPAVTTWKLDGRKVTSMGTT